MLKKKWLNIVKDIVIKYPKRSATFIIIILFIIIFALTCTVEINLPWIKIGKDKLDPDKLRRLNNHLPQEITVQEVNKNKRVKTK